MKISFSTLSCPDWSWERIVAEASRLGFDGIELRGVAGEMDLPKAAPFQEGTLDATRRQLAALGLEVPVLGSSVRFHDPDLYDAALAEGKSYIEFACRLGVPFIRIFGDRVPDPAMRKETVARIAKGIRELSASCEGRPVELLLETHGDFADADLLAEVFDQVGGRRLGILWDIEHTFKRYGDDVSPFLDRFAGSIRHIHIKDTKRVGDGFRLCRVGEGDVPLGSILATLKKLGYDGYLSLEWEKKWHPELDEPEEVIPAYIETLRRFL